MEVRRSDVRHVPAMSDATLRAQIVDVFDRKQQRYGVPRVLRELRARDIHIGQMPVARLMQEAGMQARATLLQKFIAFQTGNGQAFPCPFCR